MKSNLIADWQQQLPEDAPNHYLFNVQAEQIESINDATDALNVPRSDWYPMVRGRVIEANGESVEALYPEERGEPELYERELNLTWSDSIGKGNELVAGDFSANGLSVEQKAAQEAKLSLGDELTINIGGNIITLPITSIRTVDWGSMQPNFYLMLPKSALEDYPANFVSSLFIDETAAQPFYKAMSQFPTVSILNVGDILKQIQSIIGQLSKAIQLVLFCILSAGALVLLASVRSTLEEKVGRRGLVTSVRCKKCLGQTGSFSRIWCAWLLCGSYCRAWC